MYYGEDHECLYYTMYMYYRLYSVKKYPNAMLFANSLKFLIERKNVILAFLEW